MTKEQRLEYIKTRYKQLGEIADAVLPVTRHDIADEAIRMDSFREHVHGESKGSETITSDERS